MAPAEGGAIGIGVDVLPRFHDFVVEQHVQSFRVEEPVAVGVVLPDTMETFNVLAEFGVTGQRFTVVNDRTVVVDPRTRTVVQVID